VRSFYPCWLIGYAHTISLYSSWLVTGTLVHGENVTEQYLARLSSRGINTAVLDEMGPTSPLNMLQQIHALNVSWAAGIKAVVAVTPASASNLASYIASVKYHPALLGYVGAYDPPPPPLPPPFHQAHAPPTQQQKKQHSNTTTVLYHTLIWCFFFFFFSLPF
jgi:alcohol dehydrogenase class IV